MVVVVVVMAVMVVVVVVVVVVMTVTVAMGVVVVWLWGRRLSCGALLCCFWLAFGEGIGRAVSLPLLRAFWVR